MKSGMCLLMVELILNIVKTKKNEILKGCLDN